MPVMRARFGSDTSGSGSGRGARGGLRAEAGEGRGEEVDLLAELALGVADVEAAVVHEVGARKRPGDGVLDEAEGRLAGEVAGDDGAAGDAGGLERGDDVGTLDRG